MPNLDTNRDRYNLKHLSSILISIPIIREKSLITIRVVTNETICHDTVKVLPNPITYREKGHVIGALA